MALGTIEKQRQQLKALGFWSETMVKRVPGNNQRVLFVKLWSFIALGIDPIIMLQAFGHIDHPNGDFSMVIGEDQQYIRQPLSEWLIRLEKAKGAQTEGSFDFIAGEAWVKASWFIKVVKQHQTRLSFINSALPEHKIVTIEVPGKKTYYYVQELARLVDTSMIGKKCCEVDWGRLGAIAIIWDKHYGGVVEKRTKQYANATELFSPGFSNQPVFYQAIGA